MKVRTRLIGLVLFITGVFVVSLLLVRYCQVRTMGMIAESRYEDLQELLEEFIRVEGQSLANFACGYAASEEAHALLAKGETPGAKNDIRHVLSSFNAQSAWVFDADFHLVDQTVLPPFQAAFELPVPAEARNGLFKDREDIHFHASLPEGILEIRGVTIRRVPEGQRDSSPAGFLFVGRLWGDRPLRELAAVVHGEVTLTLGEPANTKEHAGFQWEGTFLLHRRLLGWNGNTVATLEARNQAPLFRTAVRTAQIQFVVGMLFSAILVVLVSLAILRLLNRPLRDISRSLDTGDTRSIQRYAESKTEFGHMARIILSFFQQQEELLAEFAERKRAETALAHAEADLRTLLDATADWVFLTDTDGRFLTVNGAVARGLGFDPLDLVGKNIFDFTRSEYTELRRAQVAALVTDGQPLHLEIPFGDHFFEVSVHPVVDQDGKVARIAIFARDITGRKRSEEALRRSEERFRKYFELPLIGVAMIKPDMRWIDFNDKLCAILGYSRTELEALTWSSVSFEEDLPGQLRSYEKILSGELDGRPLETRFRRKGGGAAYAEISALCIRRGDGEVEYLVALVQDISERKQAEAERLQLEEQLRQAQRLESIGRLAGGIAHDFNNLLSPIMGYTDLAVLKLEADNPLRADLDQVRHAAERMRDLTRRFLSFARRQVLEMRIVNLNLVVSEFENILRRLIGEDIQVVVKLEPALGNVRADNSQLQQIIINLAVNARDAMPAGGVLNIETSNVWLNDAYAGTRAGVPGGAYVALTVSDTGCGMPEEVKEHIFEPFFTTKDIGKGTGLGLATVYGIVRQHLGGIVVESEAGKGSVFRVYLPRVDRDLSRAPAMPELSTQRGDETVLVVEDDDGVRQVVTDLLTEHGYEVLSAANGTEALQAAECHQRSIHLLLTDVVMPGMNGRELHRRLALVRPDVKVLYISGYTGDTAFLHGVQEGQLEFMRKPFMASELTRRVRDVLEKSAAAPKDGE